MLDVGQGRGLRSVSVSVGGSAGGTRWASVFVDDAGQALVDADHAAREERLVGYLEGLLASARIGTVTKQP